MGANPFGGLFGTGANPFAPPTQNQTTPSTTGTAGSTGTDTNPSTSGSAQPTEGAQNTSSSPPPQANPFASLFGVPPTGSGAGAQQPNPIAEAARNLMQNPEAMRAAMQMMGTMNGPNANPF